MAQLVKNSPVRWETCLIPGLGRSPGEGKGYPLQYSGLENSMDCSPWGCKESDMTERLSLSCEELQECFCPDFVFSLPPERKSTILWSCEPETFICFWFCFPIRSSPTQRSRYRLQVYYRIIKKEAQRS